MTYTLTKNIFYVFLDYPIAAQVCQNMIADPAIVVDFFVPGR